MNLLILDNLLLNSLNSVNQKEEITYILEIRKPLSEKEIHYIKVSLEMNLRKILKIL